MNEKEFTVNLNFAYKNRFSDLLKEEFPKIKTRWIGAYLETPNPSELNEIQINEIADLFDLLEEIKYSIKTSKIITHGSAAKKSYIRRFKGVPTEVRTWHDDLEEQFKKYLSKMKIQPRPRLGDVDLVYQIDGRKVICELKPKSDIANLRYAISQLIDYRSKYNIKNPILQIVLGERPKNDLIKTLKSIQSEIPMALIYFDKIKNKFVDAIKIKF